MVEVRIKKDVEIREKGIKVTITQKNIDKLKEDITSAISQFISDLHFQEQKRNYKLKFKVGDRVIISRRKLISMGRAKDTKKLTGKIIKLKRYEQSYPPYLATIKTDYGREETFGVGWLKKVSK